MTLKDQNAIILDELIRIFVKNIKSSIPCL